MADRPPPTLTDDEFTGHEDALYYYAMGLPSREAVAMLERRLKDGSCLKHPYEFVYLVRWLSQRRELDFVTRRRLYGGLAKRLMAEPATFAEGVQGGLRLMFLSMDDDPEGVGFLRALVTWLADNATPAEARLVADIVENTYKILPDGGGGAPAALRPLALWLVQKGSAELRSPARDRLLAKIVELSVLDDDELFRPALRLLVHRQPAVAMLRPELRTRVWERLDIELGAGASRSLAVDLARCFGERWTAHVFVPSAHVPRLREAIVTGLLQGELDEPLAREVWGWTLAGQPPDQAEVERAPMSSLTLALNVLPFRVNPSQPREHMGLVEVDSACMVPSSAWIAAISRALIRGVGGVRALASNAEARNRALWLAGHDKTAPVFGPVLYDELQRSGPNPAYSLSIALLAPRPVGYGAAAAAVFALTTSDPPQHEPTFEVPASYRAHLHAVLHARLDDPAFGVNPGSLFGAARAVAFTSLAAEDKVRVDGDLLRVDPDYPRQLAASSRSAQEQLALLTLYVIHELVHVQQGVGAKAAVQLLRETGAEQALMHIDLAADHVAAFIAARAVVRWRLDWLKDLQGRSLADFPVRSTHPSGSRARKAARLVGVRVDRAVRESKVIPPDGLGEGYAFAEFGPGGGPFLVLASGPPVAVLLCGTIGAGDALVLASAADEENAGAAGLARVDAVLSRVLAESRRI